MAPAYKLTYFNGRGLAETIRYIFKYSGIEFEDVRVSKEEWPQMKNSTPWGQIPILEFDGKTFSQSVAIARYIANLVKLAGNNLEENLEIDSVADAITDLRLNIKPIFFEQDEARKKILIETALNDTLPYYLSRLDALVEKNNGYLALGRLTWVDFYLVNVVPVLGFISGNDVVEEYSNLKAHKERITSLPPIKAWIDARPKSDF